MSFAANEAAPLSFIQWVLTASATLLASSVAFIWRLMSRMDKIETELATRADHWEAKASADEAAMMRLADRLAQIHDDHFRVRETMSALPTRADLRELEDRVIEQLAHLASRLDRALES